jgi:antibiotic biosynthesis monooxygenase (ABM) superfamily enzyme
VRDFHRELEVIVRVWHGWTRPEDADAYERFLRDSLLPELHARVSGFGGGWVLRRSSGDEEEFVVMTLFDSLDAVRDFAGDDYETPVIEPEAARLLRRGDERAAHYEAIIQL